MLAVIAGAASLGVRNIRSADIGYHLMYGQEFFRTGRPVDSSPNIYTIPADLSNAELPPGSWIDSDGVYHFPNANWLTQVIFAAVYEAGGGVGLSIFRLLLVLGLLVITAVTMRRLGVPKVLAGAGVLLIAIVSEERFLLRPELMGYLVMAGQLCILLPDALSERGLSWKKIAGLVLLQLLLVNLHSYWMLGLGITAAVLADQLISGGWAKFAQKPRDKNLVRRMKLLLILLTAQLLVCFVNPWTWRIVALPLQTLLYFRQHNMPTSFGQIGAHPWSSIGELLPSFHDAYAGRFGTYMYILMLGLGITGSLAAAGRRRWASVLLIIAMGGMSLSMRRNIALAAIIIVPVGLGAILSLFRSFPAVATWFRRHPAWNISCGCVVILLAAGLFYGTATNKYYSAQLRDDRFAMGLHPVSTPVAAADWLNKHKPHGRVWSDYTGSSNIFFLLNYADTPDGHPEPSILTNTWAMPVEVMGEALDITKGIKPYREIFDKYGVEVVVLRNVTITMKPQIRKSTDPNGLDCLLIPIGVELLNDPQWTLVRIDPTHLVFMRNTGKNSKLARTNAIQEHTFDTKAFIERLRGMDPVAGDVLRYGGVGLQRLGWYEKSIEVLRASVEEDPDSMLAWLELGGSYGLRGEELKKFGDWKLARENFNAAKECFERTLKIAPGYKPAVHNLSLVQNDLQLLPE
ncbi:MAG: hypothetical protein KAR11_03840 [Phycisphaerae bacterium]|nr:hypothetical protein [Phycisphaerae bacterium]